MRSLFTLITTIIICSSVYADISNCQDIYVGRIRIENGGNGLSKVVFLNNPSNSSGSHWVSFISWGEEDKEAALSVLMAAKLSKQRVNLKTTESNGCGIQNGFTTASRVDLASNP